MLSAKIWIVVFIVINVLLPQSAVTNASARLAAMAAWTREGTFSIDSFQDWTIDWSLSPNGHYYANKAPGPILLGIMYFTPIYSLHNFASTTLFSAGPLDNVDAIQPFYETMLSLIFQILPMALFMYAWSEWMAKRGHSSLSVHFSLLAIGFGNTAALMMNSYFGHGVAAVFAVWAVLAWLNRRYRWFGFLIGMSALSDYPMAIAALLFSAAVLLYGRSVFLKVITGGAIPALAWTFYHWIAFGAPWSIAVKYSNPRFSEMYSGESHTIWGQVSALPDPEALFKLLFGTERGLVYTQPWIVAFFVLTIIQRRWYKKETDKQQLTLVYVTLTVLVMLLLLNSTFNAWHSGAAPGPRYISAILPAIGMAAGLLYDRFSKAARRLLWLGLIPAVVLAFLIQAAGILIRSTAIWPEVAQRVILMASGWGLWVLITVIMFVTWLAVRNLFPHGAQKKN